MVSSCRWRLRLHPCLPVHAGLWVVLWQGPAAAAVAAEPGLRRYVGSAARRDPSTVGAGCGNRGRRRHSTSCPLATPLGALCLDPHGRVHASDTPAPFCFFFRSWSCVMLSLAGCPCLLSACWYEHWSLCRVGGGTARGGGGWCRRRPAPRVGQGRVAGQGAPPQVALLSPCLWWA